MQKIAHNAQKIRLKPDANYICGIDAHTFTFAGKTFGIFSKINLLLVLLIIMTVYNIIKYQFQSIPINFVLIAIVVAFILLIPKRRLRKRNQQSRRGLEVDYNFTKDYSIKIYEEGIQLKENFFYWDKIKKIKTKGIVRVKPVTERLAQGMYKRDIECYYFIDIDNTMVRLHENLFRQYNNPIRSVKKALKKLGKTPLLDEKGMEWVKGKLEDTRGKNWIKSMFEDNSGVALYDENYESKY